MSYNDPLNNRRVLWYVKIMLTKRKIGNPEPLLES